MKTDTPTTTGTELGFRASIAHAKYLRIIDAFRDWLMDNENIDEFMADVVARGRVL